MKDEYSRRKIERQLPTCRFGMLSLSYQGQSQLSVMQKQTMGGSMYCRSMLEGSARHASAT